MSKKELLAALESLDDGALVYVRTFSGYDNPSEVFILTGYADKITDEMLQNEITLIASR